MVIRYLLCSSTLTSFFNRTELSSIAFRNPDIGLLRLLIENGSDPDADQFFQKTAGATLQIPHLRYLLHQEICMIDLDAPANTSLITPFMMHVYDNAKAGSMSIEALQLWRAKRINFDAKDAYGWTIFQWALKGLWEARVWRWLQSTEEIVSIFSFLISCSGDLHAVASDGLSVTLSAYKFELDHLWLAALAER